MGLATIDPPSQKEHTEIHKIPKFDANRASFDWDTGISNGKTFIKKCIEMQTHTFLCKFSTFWNARISVKTSPINTKLGDFVNLGVLYSCDQ